MGFLTLSSEGEGDTRQYSVAQGLRIGRSADNDLVLPDPGVSRNHAQIVTSPQGLLIQDLNSRNGTYVNGKPIASYALKPGDVIRIGPSFLRYDEEQPRPVEFSEDPLPGNIRTSAFDPAGGIEATHTFLPPATVSRLLWETDRELLSQRPLSEILEQAMDIVHRMVPYGRGALMLGDGPSMSVKVQRDYHDTADPERPGGRAPIVLSRAITRHVLETGESVLASDAYRDTRFAGVHSIGDLRVRSVLCVPLRGRSQTTGLIYIDSLDRPALFNEQTLQILTFMAGILGLRIENQQLAEQVAERRRKDKELLDAADIMKRLLPRAAPRIDGYLLDGTSIACYEVGGDLYDYIELPGNRIGIAIGDVAGKGLPAAVLMSQVQAHLRAYAAFDLPLDAMVSRLNEALYRCFPEGRFVTFFYGVLDATVHRMAYVNAGHNPPWLIQPDREPFPLVGGGWPLGLFPDNPIEAVEVELHEGGLLACYSDGVTDAANSGDELYGVERFASLVRETRGRVPSEIIGDMLESLDRHVEGQPHQDDITLVMLKRLDREEARHGLSRREPLPQ